MKNSLRWHRECLKNRQGSLEWTIKEIAKLRVTAERLEKENAFHEKQIAQAEKEGRDGFDSERYMRKREAP
jgi:hypothetical protein